MAMMSIDEHFVINEIKCLISSTRKEYSVLQNQEAVEKILWEAANEIAATKSGTEIDRSKYERLYLESVKSRQYYKPKPKKAGSGGHE